MSLFSEPFYELMKKYSTEYLVKKSMNGILHIEVKDAEDKASLAQELLLDIE